MIRVLVVGSAAHGGLATRVAAHAEYHVQSAQTIPGLGSLLSDARWDVVVAADDGLIDPVAALAIARLRQPGASRIAVLAVTADEQRRHALLELAHQVIRAAPDPDETDMAVRMGVEGIARAHPELPSEMDDVIGRLLALPSVADLFDTLQAIAEDGRQGIRELSAVMARDPAMTAKVLHLASAGFARRSIVVHDVAQAAALLGLERLREIILGSAVFLAAEDLGVAGDVVAQAQRHGEAAAIRLRTRSLPDYVATGALLLDIGLPLMAMAWPDGHAAARDFCAETSTDLFVEERRRFGVTHAHAGASLLRRWSLPQPLIAMVAGHHFVPLGRTIDDDGLGFLAHHAAQTGDPSGVDPYHAVSPRVPLWVDEVLGLAGSTEA